MSAIPSSGGGGQMRHREELRNLMPPPGREYELFCFDHIVHVVDGYTFSPEKTFLSYNIFCYHIYLYYMIVLPESKVYESIYFQKKLAKVDGSLGKKKKPAEAGYGCR
jgi:hypothetical protein